MTDELAEALVALFERLGPYVQADPQLRDAVAGLGRALTVWTEQLAPREEAPAPLPPTPVAEPAHPLPPPPPVVIPPDFSLARPPAPAARGLAFADEDDRGITPVDIGVIARRCRLKSEAARSAAARLRGDTFHTPDDLITRANALPDCDLWMLHPGDYVEAPKAWDDLGGAFERRAETAAAAGA